MSECCQCARVERERIERIIEDWMDYPLPNGTPCPCQPCGVARLLLAEIRNNVKE